jgi:hypothetical protein
MSRVRFYDGEFLKDGEFIDEQKYHLDRRQRHDRLLHVAGVAEGLDASKVDDKTIKVSAGTAIDDLGQQILLDRDQTLTVGAGDNGTLFVQLLFAETADHLADENSAVSAATRFSQTPVLKLGAVLDPHAVPLGKASINSGAVAQVTAAGRVYSGLRLAGMGSATSLRGRADVAALAELAGSLSVTGSLSVGSAQAVAPAKLSLGTDAANTKLALYDNPADLYGLGIQASQLRLHLGNAGARFSFLDGPAGKELVTIQGSGNVGIGTTDPAGHKLRVSGGDVLLDGKLEFGAQVRQMMNLWNANYGVGVQNATLYFRTDKNVAFYKGGAHNDAELNAGGGTPMLVINDGNVGVGTADPAGFKLHVAGTALFDGALRAGNYVAGGAAGLNAFSLEVGGPDPTTANGLATIFLHHHGKVAHQLRYASGTLYLERAGNGYGTSDTPALSVGGDLAVGGSADLGYERGVASFDQPLTTGAYQNGGAHVTGDVPDTTHAWTHLLVTRHSNQGNHHVLQIASSYAENDRLFFRKVARTLPDAARPGWNEVATRASNTFTGTQVVQGAITPSVGNAAGNGLMFPTNPGSGGSDAAWLRYYVVSGETTKLVLGIDNDADDTLGLWQMGKERLTIYNGNVGVGTASPPEGLSLANGVTLMLGVGDTNRDGDAGKIAYKRWTRGLDIVGTGDGNDFTKRQITFHAQGGANFLGDISVANAVRLNNPTNGGIFFRMYYEAGNDTVVFYHNNGNGQFMRQDGAWHQNSDASLKENVAGLHGILSKVAALRPVSFDWKSNGMPGIGFVAQEVERVFPELVAEHRPEEGKTLKGLPYASFSVLAIAAIQELKEEHEARIRELEAKIAVLSGSS